MPREIYHDEKTGDWQACTPLEDLKYCLPYIVVFFVEIGLGWVVWHYCRVKGYL